MPKVENVVTTDPIHPAAARILAEAGHDLIVASDNPAATLKQMLAIADGLIVRSKLADDALDGAPRLRGVVRHGVGLDFIPVRRATELAIPVANVPGANAQAVAEYVYAAMLDLTRRLQAADRLLRERTWNDARAVAGSSVELQGKRLGIVGFGNVGRRVASIGAAGFGMQVLTTPPRTSALPEFVQPVALAELFAISDFVVLCCPLTEETRGMVDAALLAQMKSTAYLINAARGQLIDDEALIVALAQKQIAGAALDVFAHQPLSPDHPFRKLPNVLLTPHLASLTVDSMELIGRLSCEEIVRMLRGERPINFVNPDVWASAQARWHSLETQT